jgi:molybdopterin-synthase adenylyltransferase
LTLSGDPHPKNPLIFSPHCHAFGMGSIIEPKSLSPLEEEIYSWQTTVGGFGTEGQRRLKNASVLVSRCGGLGGVVAYELAAAGVGRLVLAHAGNVKPSDLNRQLLMTRDWLGKPRIESIERRLKELNPDLEIVAVPENPSEANADGLVEQADLVVDAAPLFEERYALNRAAVEQNKPMVECAVYELEAHLTTIFPGESPCLRCIYPEQSTTWTRRFPVFGAVSGSLGGMAALEAIKVLGGFGSPLKGRLLTYDMRDFTFRTLRIRRNVGCSACGHR